MEPTELLLLISCGALGGFLAGFLGVGGGIIFIPVFDYFLRLQGIEGEELVRSILANSFLCILFSGLVSSYKQYKLGNFYPKHILFMAIPAMLFAWIVTDLIAHYDWYSELYFKFFFVLLLLYTLVRSNLRRRKEQTAGVEDNRFWKSGIIGSAAGVVSAFSGLGGGVVMIPLMNGFSRFSMKKAASISIGVIPLLAIPHLLVYAQASPDKIVAYQLGYLHFGMAVPMVLGVLLSSGFGVSTAQRVQEKYLKLIFAILIIILIVKYTLEISS